MKHFILCLLSCFLLSGCIVDESDSTQSNLSAFQEFDAENLSLSADEISGTGRLMAPSSFKSIRTNAHFFIAGQFLAESSQFTLHLFFDSFEFDSGLQLRIGPSPENPQDLIIALAEPSRPFQTLTVIPKAVAEDRSFILRVETQNKINNQRRILIWNDSLFFDSEIRRPKEQILSGNAEYDSQRANDVFYSWGTGLRWGVHIEETKLLELRRETPYVAP